MGIKEPAYFVSLRRIVIDQQAKQEVGVDGNHTARPKKTDALCISALGLRTLGSNTCDGIVNRF